MDDLTLWRQIDKEMFAQGWRQYALCSYTSYGITEYWIEEYSTLRSTYRMSKPYIEGLPTGLSYIYYRLRSYVRVCLDSDLERGPSKYRTCKIIGRRGC